MARIFRVSGYLVCDRETTAKELESYFDTMPGEWWQQFHIEQSEEFILNEFQLYMNMRDIFGIDLLKCL